MEADSNIADLTSVSFADFETKNNDGSAAFESYGSCEPKDDISMTLNLSLGQKTENLFAADQTPTPTRLIKNCDEVGLFEDLQHVNPFDIGFQRAAEQNAVGGALPGTPTRSEVPANEADSLHTPQVYSLETPTVCAAPPAVSNSNSPLDVEELLRTPVPASTAAPASTTDNGPPPLQLIQPQVITWVLPAQAVPITAAPVKIHKNPTDSTPVQTVRPYILPKPSTPSTSCKASVSATVPSSASLTPTSQLPIKERLKAILNNSNNRKQRSFGTTAPKSKSTVMRNEEGMERRRAAASRYRHKMRNEHKELKEHNTQLQQKVRELQERIATLEREIQQQNNNVVPNQIQIPPSSIHLVINVPKMIVPSATSDLRLDPT